MTTRDETAPPSTTPPPTDDSAADVQRDAAAAGEAGEALDPPAAGADPADGLSPAVRRLVRQYDLDITGIHGTGPDGRIRVGDVIGILGPRAEQAVHGPIAKRPAAAEDHGSNRDEPGAAGELAIAAATAAAPAAASAAVMTTVFECDLSRVLAHRRRQRDSGVEILLTSYFLAAYVDALGAVPELTADHTPHFGVLLTTADGDARPLRFDAAGSSTEPLAERARTIDTALRAGVGADLASTNLLVHHYGASGSLIATPTPLGAGHAASLGIGRVRREIVLRNVDGDESPRVTPRCYLSLSFLPEHVTLPRANQFLAHAVRVLEQWPE